MQIGAAVQRFKAADKPVLAYADEYSQSAYLIAAQASEVHLHPMGQVGIEGFSTYPLYFRDLIDKIGLEVNVFRVGEFKSAVEPFIRNDMSAASREANRGWLSDLWDVYKQNVAAARSLRRRRCSATPTAWPICCSPRRATARSLPSRKAWWMP